MNTTAWWAWSPSLEDSTQVKSGLVTWPSNLAIKQIVGATTTYNITAYTNGTASKYKIMQCKEVPPLAFLDHKPIIVTTDAKVVLAQGTGQVRNFEIVGEPEAQSDPWFGHFRHANEPHTKGTVATTGSVWKQHDPGIGSTIRIPELTGDGRGSSFLTQLFETSSIAPMVIQLGSCALFVFGNLWDNRNIRDKEKGYDIELTSYANW